MSEEYASLRVGSDSPRINERGEGVNGRRNSVAAI
jgi:hypothetical protein